MIWDGRSSAPWEKGFVHVYTGEGKGKTTAALGLAIRAAGAGLKVFVGQFIKSGAYSEIRALGALSNMITVRQYGRGCFIRGACSPDDKRMAENGLREMEEIVSSGRYHVVIADEANVAAQIGLFPAEKLVDLIRMKHRSVELVLTGRHADPRVIEAADLVTDMREVKHYYRQGVPARRGIES
jgi:cob(I)alamin adenosyltransferase